MSRSTSELVRIITSADPAQRNRSLDAVCRNATLEQLLAECAALDRFRRTSDNLYERVRALFFLYAIYRFHLPPRLESDRGALIPFDGYANLLKRRFEEAIDIFLQTQAAAGGLSDGIASALAAAYHSLGFRLWPTRCGAACVRCAATSGCSASVTRLTTRCAYGLSCCSARRRARACIPSCTRPRLYAWT